MHYERVGLWRSGDISDEAGVPVHKARILFLPMFEHRYHWKGNVRFLSCGGVDTALSTSSTIHSVDSNVKGLHYHELFTNP